MLPLPNKEEFEKVYKELELKGEHTLNLTHIHRIFGQRFFELMTLCLCDARIAGYVLGQTSEQIKIGNKEI